jgi:uncharacterized protein (TIGR03435 family)
MRVTAASALILATLCGAFGQSFEVASIKVRQGAPQWKFAISGTRLTIESYTLFGLLREAYNVQSYRIQLAGAPPLLLSNDTLYDVIAKAEGEGNPARDDFREMLQSLLAERFRLKVHREPKEIPVYALVVGKGGPKFHASAPDANPAGHFGFTGPNNEYALATLPNTTMKGLADSLGLVEGRPVLDETGLAGNYEIKLYSTPEYKMSRGPESAPGELSILTAVQDQPGLRLEPQKRMIDMLVVDHVEKPSEN